MGRQKSVPITVPDDTRASASARSPVPQQTSTATEWGWASASRNAVAVAFRQAISHPRDRKWLRKSYRGATAANMSRTARPVETTSSGDPRGLPMKSVTSDEWHEWQVASESNEATRVRKLKILRTRAITPAFKHEWTRPLQPLAPCAL